MAARGRLDYSKFDPLVPEHYIREHMFSVYTENELMAEVAHLYFQNALVGLHPMVPDATLRSAGRLSERMLGIMVDAKMPWMPGRQDRKEKMRDEAQEARDQWSRVYGDPQDPKVKAAVDRAVEKMRAQRQGK